MFEMNVWIIVGKFMVVKTVSEIIRGSASNFVIAQLDDSHSGVYLYVSCARIHKVIFYPCLIQTLSSVTLKNRC